MKKQNPYIESTKTPPLGGEQMVQAASSGAPEKPVAFDGFQQVLEMLKIADPLFRESLLKRLAQRDVELARTLRQDLREAGL